MFPDLIDLNFIHIRTYGVCMAIGFLLCWNIFERISGRKDLSNLLFAMLLSGIIGSRIAYVIEHWSSEFAKAPLRIIRIDQGGLMFYGGLILALAVFVIWCICRKENPLKIGDNIACVIPLGHAFGRIGCFFYGCCYGKRSDSCLAVCFPRDSPAWYEQFRAGEITYGATKALPVLPSQLFEAFALALFFFVLLFLRSRTKDKSSGIITGTYLAGYAVIRFVLEYVRGDPRASVGLLSISQTISVIMFAIGAGVVAFALRRSSVNGR